MHSSSIVFTVECNLSYLFAPTSGGKKIHGISMSLISCRIKSILYPRKCRNPPPKKHHFISTWIIDWIYFSQFAFRRHYYHVSLCAAPWLRVYFILTTKIWKMMSTAVKSHVLNNVINHCNCFNDFNSFLSRSYLMVHFHSFQDDEFFSLSLQQRFKGTMENLFAWLTKRRPDFMG